MMITAVCCRVRAYSSERIVQHLYPILCFAVILTNRTKILFLAVLYNVECILLIDLTRCQFSRVLYLLLSQYRPVDYILTCHCHESDKKFAECIQFLLQLASSFSISVIRRLHSVSCIMVHKKLAPILNRLFQSFSASFLFLFYVAFVHLRTLRVFHVKFCFPHFIVSHLVSRIVISKQAVPSHAAMLHTLYTLYFSLSLLCQ